MFIRRNSHSCWSWLAYWITKTFTQFYTKHHFRLFLLFVNEVRNSIEQTHCWEADSFSATQDIFSYLWNPKGSFPFSQKTNGLKLTQQYIQNLMKASDNLTCFSRAVIFCYHAQTQPRCTRKNYKLEELQTDSVYLEQVQSYKYLGSTVNSDNSIEGEIQYRIFFCIEPLQCFVLLQSSHRD
jgi:hypothetical protein